MLGGMSWHQHVVDPLEDLAGRVEALGGGAQHGAGRRHHQGGGHALVGHVPDDEPEAAVLELEEVVEVAADLAGRLVVGRHVVARQLRQRLGQEGLLDQARHPELLLDALPLLGLLLLLPDELGHPHRRGRLGRQIAKSLRSSAEYSCWLRRGPRLRSPISSPWLTSGTSELDAGLLHLPQRRRIEVQLVDLDHPGDAREVREDRVVRALCPSPAPPAAARPPPRASPRAAPRAVAPEEVLPEPLSCSSSALSSDLLARHSRCRPSPQRYEKRYETPFREFLSHLEAPPCSPPRRSHKRGVRRLHRLPHHPDQLVAEPVQVGLVPKPRREGFERLRRVVLPAVEAPIDRSLDASPQGVEQRRYREGGGDDDELRVRPPVSARKTYWRETTLADVDQRPASPLASRTRGRG